MSADAKPVRHGQMSAGCVSSRPESLVQVKGIEDRIRAGVDVGETVKNGVTKGRKRGRSSFLKQ